MRHDRTRLHTCVRPCYDCGRFLAVTTGGRLRCTPCANTHNNKASIAHHTVAAWVRDGMLPNLKTYAVACRDCGERADRYDHRDYDKPLHITPVCRTCNRRRGTVARVAA